MTATIEYAPARVDTTIVVVAPLPHGALKGWRRLIQTVDPAREGAFALQGQPLDPGGAYLLPNDALLVTHDLYPLDRHIRLLRVRPGGLELVKEWRQKAPLGARVVKAVTKALPVRTVHRAVPVAGVPNRFSGHCYRCGQHVPGGAGNIINIRGSSRVTHTDQCPPVPPRPNERDDWCRQCGKPVAAGAGLLYREWDDLTSSPRWVVTHPTSQDCDAAPEDRPNRWLDWCADCGGLIRAGHGIWRDRAVRHGTGCGTPAALPTWVTKAPGRRSSRGDVVRAVIHPRPGERPIPIEAPGAAVLDDGLTSLIVTVLDVHDRGDGVALALVRAATWDEACELLADEVDLAVDATPNPRGFKAAWAAEQIGPAASSRGPDIRGCRPWVAEITGHDRRYGLRRTFLPARRDYTQATNSGSRGIWYRWVLSPNAVYEAYRPTKWGGVGRRLYLRVTPDGGTEEISREQVEARLRHGLTWVDPSLEEM